MGAEKFLEWIIVGGVVTAVVKFIENVVLAKMNGKTRKLTNIETAISLLQEDINTIKESERVVLHDRLKFLCTSMINKGVINYSDRKDISDMHHMYKMLNGNGGLTHLVETVMELPLSAG